MPSVSMPKGPDAIDHKYLGVIFDEYTPQVEAQLLRDCLAAQSVADRNEELVIACESDKADRMLESIGIRRVPLMSKARELLLYKTEEFWPEYPEHIRTVILRDLYVPKKNPNVLLEVDPDQANGYYLPPQGRLSPDTLSLERPAPNGYIPLDPSMIMQWTAKVKEPDTQIKALARLGLSI